MRLSLATLLTLSVLVFTLPASPALAQTAQPPIVHAVMFWMDGCSHCEDVIQNVLPPLHEKYGSQFELLMIEVVDTQDLDILYGVAASYNIPKEQTGVPFLVINDQVIVGSSAAREQLPAVIEDYLRRGGVGWPVNPSLAGFLPEAGPAPEPLVARETPIPADRAPGTSAVMRNNGFALATVILVGMAIGMLYSLIAFATGKSRALPAWTDRLIPLLIVTGLGVAGYLSYVETQSAGAVCGPVGDCNTVQQSRYATLFGVLPIGVLGLFGYLGLLAAWLVRKYIPHLEEPATIAYFGLAFFAVIFSLYLTYLEPFVIKAVCAWCLASSVIVTLLLLLSRPPVTQQFLISGEDE